MEQKDYLMKQVEQFGLALGKILARLLHLKDNGTESIVAVNQVFTEELDFDVNHLIDIDEDKWLDTLKTENRFNAENLERLADILLLVAENVSLNERNQLCKKCRMIYEYLDESTKTYPFDRNSKMERIRKYMNENVNN